MDGVFNKIIIVSLSGVFTRKVGKVLSQKLEMLFCDARDLLEYELVDKNSMKKFCTVEYLQEAEKNVFEKLASFENVVAAIDCDDFLQNFDVLKAKSLIVFLDLPKNLLQQFDEKINLLAYKNRSESLKKCATIACRVTSLQEDEMSDKIIEDLGGIL